MERLNKKFFERNPKVVAKELLGKLLIRKKGNKTAVGRIVEMEAYLSENDKASHARMGQTKRNTPMFGPAGRTYVYFTYGMHWLLNVVTEREGAPSAVLIRALEPISDSKEPGRIASGPAKLTKWMAIDGKLNNIDIINSNELFIADAPKIPARQIVSSPRVGVQYAKEHKDIPLRFYLKGNKSVSKY